MTHTPGTLEERLRGGKCHQCQGWGEVAYFGEMVGCTCLGRYEAPISMATRVEAAAEIASLRARVEVMEGLVSEFVSQITAGKPDGGGEVYVEPVAVDLVERARQALKDTPDAE